MSTSLLMFIVFIAITLGITYWASRRTKTIADFYAAGRQITGFQNGWAVAGDYMSAASFLGIAGLIAFFGYDGFLYSVGWLVAYLTVLLLVAKPLRNTGKFTMADVLAFRLRHKSVRTVAALSTLTVSLFYMIAQMVGAGPLVNLLIPGITFEVAIIGVGIIMLIYVIFGGMLATTWVQIIKAVLLMCGAILLTLFWRRFNTTGMVVGMLTGLTASLVLIVLSPAVMGVDPPTATVRQIIQAAPIFPLENPGIVSVPLGFIAAIVGSLLTRDERAELTYSELNVRSNTRLGAEV